MRERRHTLRLRGHDRPTTEALRAGTLVRTRSWSRGNSAESGTLVECTTGADGRSYVVRLSGLSANNVLFDFVVVAVARAEDRVAPAR